MSQASSKRVVIYGGGMAGAILAKELSKTTQVTLVDPNDYFEVPMAVPRSLVKPDFAEAAILPFATALPDVTIVHGMLTELQHDGGLVTRHDGQTVKLSADVTVLATGSRFSNTLMRATGTTAQARKSFYAEYSERIKTSGSILIVGGGPIGVEVAGEITETYPDKQVTILEAGARILAGTTAAAAAYAHEDLTQRGVSIITGERLINANSTPSEALGGGGTAITEKGRLLNYDLIIWCMGGRPNTGYMHKHFATSLNDKGQIKVAPSLRVMGTQQIFALGDITDLKENKMAWHVTGHVRSAKTNILRVLAGDTQEARLKSHAAQTGNPMMAVTLGSQKGVVHLPVIGLIKCPTLTRMAKAGHMLVPKYRKILRA